MGTVSQIEDKSKQADDLSAKPPRRRWFWAAGAASLVVLAGAVAVVMAPVNPLNAFSGGLSSSTAWAAGEEGETITAAAAQYIPMPEIIANLSGGAKPRFVKLRVMLRAASGETPAVRARQAEIQDAFVSYLHALHPDEYFGAAGFERLRTGLYHRARLAMGGAPGAVEDVLILEFVRQ